MKIREKQARDLFFDGQNVCVASLCRWAETEGQDLWIPAKLKDPVNLYLKSK